MRRIPGGLRLGKRILLGVAALTALTTAVFADPTPGGNEAKEGPRPAIRFRSGWEWQLKKALKQSPDGKLVLKVAWLRRATARLWDREAGWVGERLYHEAEEGMLATEITCWAFSPDGKLVATGSGFAKKTFDGPISVGSIKVWDTTTGKLMAEYQAQGIVDALGSVEALAFSADSKTVYYKAQRYDNEAP
jgi:WD40 repeat protein